jgi:uncharacterized membrane protein YsdA (DUF1294 family)
MTSTTTLFIFLVILISINLTVFIFFAVDKGAARKNLRRTSERTLLFLAFFGPFGAYLAMKICRHKTRKSIFYLVPVFLFVQLVVMAYGIGIFFK